VAERGLVTTLVKRGFGLVGLDVRRKHPTPAPSFGWLQRRGIGTVLDIGANTGQFLEFILGILPEAHVYSFEPLPDCFEQLAQRAAGRPNVTTFNVALGDRDGTATIHRSEYSPSSSLLPMGELHKAAFPHTRRTSVEEVVVKRLDGLDLPIEGRLLVKMDVQGYEDHVIAGGRATLERTDVVVTELSFYPLYEGQALFDDVYRLLRDLGFSYRGSLGAKKDPRDGAVLDEDGVFTRE